ncbi:MAG: PGPGW domain-containing protein [Caulobacter sp.]|nr:PGPGW domain-containing protein [Caulobacter sp.]
MSLALTMPRAFTPADDAAREMLARAMRSLLFILGLAIVAAGVLIAPLPGPGGLPVIVIGLMVTLRNSFWAKRQFIRFQRAHPKVVFPIRRLLRRDPEIIPMVWQQLLRMERVVLGRKQRFARRMRRHLRKPRQPAPL